ncbi:MAG: hypothetical protein ACR2QC_00055 [Gammaproteobacteria bacterium]
MPPFRRKPKSHSCVGKGKRPSHSREGRNLRAEGANCKRGTITRRFAAAEIPAFAGMERGIGMGRGVKAKRKTPEFFGSFL